MSTFEKADTQALANAYCALPMASAPAEKGRFFNYTWWPQHGHEVFQPVLDVVNTKAPAFDKRVDILGIANEIDKANDKQLVKMGFTPSEITRYVTRAVNKGLKKLTGDSGHYYVIRNQRLTQIALEHKPA